jgi:hypothetical protein
MLSQPLSKTPTQSWRVPPGAPLLLEFADGTWLRHEAFDWGLRIVPPRGNPYVFDALTANGWVLRFRRSGFYLEAAALDCALTASLVAAGYGEEIEWN